MMVGWTRRCVRSSYRLCEGRRSRDLVNCSVRPYWTQPFVIVCDYSLDQASYFAGIQRPVSMADVAVIAGRCRLKGRAVYLHEIPFRPLYTARQLLVHVFTLLKYSRCSNDRTVTSQIKPIYRRGDVEFELWPEDDELYLNHGEEFDEARRI